MGRLYLLKEFEWWASSLFPFSTSPPPTMSRSNEKKPETLVQVYEPADIYYSPEGDTGPDRVYHAKARLLNTAVREIGVGKYQVRPQPYSPLNLANLSSTEVALLCHRFRMVCR